MRRELQSVMLILVVSSWLCGIGCDTMSASKREKFLQDAHYVEYFGAQRDWPLSTELKPRVEKTKYDLVIYHSLPERPYEVLGSIRTVGKKALKDAAHSAQAAKADALVVCPDQTYTQAGIAISPGVELARKGSNRIALLQGVLIRWKQPPKEALSTVSSH